jgi:hypothetical protein
MGDDLNLSPMIDMNIAAAYIAKVKLLDKEFFDDFDEFKMLVFNRHTLYCYVTEERSKLANFGLSIVGYGAVRRLRLKGEGFEPNTPVWKALALFVFSVAFSPRYADLRSQYPKFADLCDDFYAQLANSAPLPPISKDTREDIVDKLKSQNAYARLFNGSDPLIKEYEGLERTHKTISFNPDPSLLEFKSLQSGTEKLETEILTDKDIGTPQAKAETIRKRFGYAKFKRALETYQAIFSEIRDDSDRLFDYSRYTIGLVYNLIASRTTLGEELDILSPFTDDAKAIANAISFINKDLLGYLIKNDPDVLRRLTTERDGKPTVGKEITIDGGVYTLYHKALSLAVIHAKNKKERAEYRRNLDALLRSFYNERESSDTQGSRESSDTRDRSPTDNVCDLLFGDAKERKELEEFNAAIKALFGITDISAQIEQFDAARGGGAGSVDTKTTTTTEGSKGADVAKIFQSIADTDAYKRIAKLASITAFAGSGLRIYLTLNGEKELDARDTVELSADLIYIADASLKFLASAQTLNIASNPYKPLWLAKHFGKFAGRAIPILATALYSLDFYEIATKDEKDPDDARKLIFISIHIIIGVFEIAATFAGLPIVFLITIPLRAIVGVVNMATDPNFSLSKTISEIADAILYALKPSLIELYIERSLYYEPSFPNRGSLLNFGSYKSNAIEPIILGEATDSPRKFSDANDLRKRLANLYDSDKKLYYDAMNAELTELNAALRGYAIIVAAYDGTNPIKLTPRQTQINIYIGNLISLSEPLRKDVKYAVLSYRQGSKRLYQQSPSANIIEQLIDYGREGYARIIDDRYAQKAQGFNRGVILPNQNEQVAIIEDMLKESAIIVVTREDLKLKFRLGYRVRNITGNNEVRITDASPTYLDDQDEAFLKTIEDADKQTDRGNR